MTNRLKWLLIILTATILIGGTYTGLRLYSDKIIADTLKSSTPVTVPR